MRISPALLVCLQFLCGSVCPEDADRARRDLSMLRMGKRGVEVLPARAIELPPLVPPNYEVGDEYEERELILPENGVPRQIWIPRVGKDMETESRYARHPPFPRMGTSFEDYLKEIRRDLSEGSLRDYLIKYPQTERRRRSAEDSQGAAENTEHKSQHRRSLPTYSGLSQDEDTNSEFSQLQQRAMPFPRIGLQERGLPFPRLGLVERAFPRIGLQERSAFGEYDEDSEQKRGMSMLRMGKRGMKMLRMGKRPVNMLRMGRSQATDSEQEEKRAMSMLRMGKRPMSMLRMGRSGDADEKRAIGMLRMGKRGMSMLRMGRSSDVHSDTDDKRAMSMLRMGRSDLQADSKRAMSMLRMGKRPVSMLRMGKRDTDRLDSEASDS